MKASMMDLHVAKETMFLKNSNYCLSFIRTVWKGEVIMCVYDNLQKALSNIYCLQILRSDDVEQLENLISNFLHLNEEN